MKNILHELAQVLYMTWEVAVWEDIFKMFGTPNETFNRAIKQMKYTKCCKHKVVNSPFWRFLVSNTGVKVTRMRTIK